MAAWRPTPPIIKLEHLPKMTSELKTDFYEVRLRYKEVTFLLRLRLDSITFLSKNGLYECITIQIFQDYIYLAAYYYNKQVLGLIKLCPSIPHELFFELLKEIARIYEKPAIHLYDDSTKHIPYTDCVLPAVLFSIAGLPTFYERFGFENSAYSSFVRDVQSMKFEELVDKVRMSRRTNTRYLRAIQILRSYRFNENPTMQEVAEIILRNCKKSSSRNSKISRRVSRASVMSRRANYVQPTALEQWMTDFLIDSLKQDQVDPTWILRV